MSRVRLPRLLSNRMEELNRLHPSKAGLSFALNAPHSARVTIPQGAEVPAFHAFVEMYTIKGSAGIYRVNAFDEDVGSQTVVRMQHGLCVLADDTPVFARNDNGGLDEIEGTVGSLLTRLWSMRGVDVAPSFWRLGSIAETPVVKYQPGTDSLLQAVQTIIQKARGYALSYDQSVFPWVLNVVQLSDSNPCEGRFSRNLEGVHIGMDDSDMVTRVYLDDRDGHTDADTIDTWGVVSEILSVPENATDESAAAYAADYLEAHKNPAVTIECSGADLSAITGESIDSLDLGRMCRACLPDYHATINERIVALDVPDVYGDPYGVRVSMSNKAETTADLLTLVENETRRLSSASTVNGRRAGGAGAQAENNRLELIEQSYELTDTRERMRLAGIIIDGDLALVQLLAKESVLEDTRSRLSYAGITLDGTAASVQLLAKQQTVDTLTGRVDNAEASITVNADAIETKVSKNGVISSINQTAESVTIKASKINLSGYVTASQLEANFADIGARLETTQLVASQAEVSGTLSVPGDLRLSGELCTWASRTVQTGIPDFNKATITLANGNSISVVTGWADAPSNYRRTLYYLSHT